MDVHTTWSNNGDDVSTSDNYECAVYPAHSSPGEQSYSIWTATYWKSSEGLVALFVHNTPIWGRWAVAGQWFLTYEQGNQRAFIAPGSVVVHVRPNQTCWRTQHWKFCTKRLSFCVHQQAVSCLYTADLCVCVCKDKLLYMPYKYRNSDSDTWTLHNARGGMGKITWSPQNATLKVTVNLQAPSILQAQ